MRKLPTSVIIAFAVGALGACEPAEEQRVGAEACEHFQDGPYNDVTATDMMMGAPDISGDHSAHRIDTVEVDTDGNRGGFVSFTPTMDGMMTFFLSHHFDIMGMNSADAMVMPDKSVHEVTACDEVAMFHVFDMTADEPYSLELGPTQEETLTIVWQHGDAGEGDTGQHDHDGEDHDM
jgi:hypothetical protein